MAVRLYADEQFPKIVVKLLREFGHDILTVQEAGKANQRIPDEDVLAFAIVDNRAVLTIEDEVVQVYVVAIAHRSKAYEI